jgi:plasmid maintenance system antidote protein VapI
MKMLLKNIENEWKKKQITELLEEQIAIHDKEIEVAKRLVKKLRNRKQFFLNVLKSQQTIENLKVVIEHVS